MTEIAAHELATAEDWNRARHRESILRPLATQSSLSEADIRLGSKQMGIGRAYFYRLLAAYKLRPQTSTLLPGRDGLAAGTHLLPPGTESLVHRCIEEFYMSRVRPSFAALKRRISQECRRIEVPVPNHRTIKRRLATYDPKELSKARFGAKVAEEAFRPVQVNHQPTLPFQLLQVDHSPVDLIVLDERDRLPIGRPWITLAIDIPTRCVAGFYLSLEPPSIVSVAMVLTQCVLPKDTWLADRGLDSLEWPLSSCTLRPEWTWFVIKDVRSISANVVVLIDRIIVLNDRKISPRPLCNAKCQIRTRLPFILEMFTKLSSSVLTSTLYRTPPKTLSRQCNASGACGTVRALGTIPSGC